MARRQYTKELLKAEAEDRQIVVSSGVMYYERSASHEWPVVYRPRHLTDARPWLALSSDGSEPSEEGYALRYSGRECTVESRFVIDKVGDGSYTVRDLIAGMVDATFLGANASAYRKAELYSLERNREDRRKLIGHSI
jgi:hypothetical protein